MPFLRWPVTFQLKCLQDSASLLRMCVSPTPNTPSLKPGFLGPLFVACEHQVSRDLEISFSLMICLRSVVLSPLRGPAYCAGSFLTIFSPSCLLTLWTILVLTWRVRLRSAIQEDCELWIVGGYHVCWALLCPVYGTEPAPSRCFPDLCWTSPPLTASCRCQKTDTLVLVAFVKHPSSIPHRTCCPDPHPHSLNLLLSLFKSKGKIGYDTVNLF